MNTPNFDHLSKYPSVYEPSEDTFLFLDALEQELPFIKSLNPKFIAEIGSGSGVNITSLSKQLNCLSIATDINLQACLATKETKEVNQSAVEVCNMNFLDCFRNNFFDVILFNPPYVVTDSSEIFGGGIERSWAGGLRGREVMDKLFPKLKNLLTKNGVFYLVVIKENRPMEIMEQMKKMKFKCEVVKERRILGEHLFVLKFQNCIDRC